MTSLRRFLSGLTGICAFLAFLGAVALGILEGFEIVLIPPLYERVLLGMGVAALMGIAFGLLTRPVAARPSPPPAPPPRKERPVPASLPPKDEPVQELGKAFEQVRTYIDLEMWELALERADFVLKEYPASREARIISRNINDLRWKAEPKFVHRESKEVSGEERKRLRQEGLARLVKHVQTYMELEMWELAKQKSVAILKHYPDADETRQVASLYQEIEKRLRKPPETVAQNQE